MQYVKSLAFTQDGKFLISGSWDNDVGNVKVWDATGWREVRAINTGDALVHSVAVSPDGGTLATGGREKVLKTWDLKAGQIKHAIDAHPRDIQGVAFSGDGKFIATCGHDSPVKLWDAETGRAVMVINNRNDKLHWDGVAFSPGGPHYVAACGVTLRMFDLTRGQEAWPDVIADETMTHCLAFSPDGKRLATGGTSKAVKLWDVETGKLLETWKGDVDRIVAVAFNHDGTWLASSSANSGEIRMWPVPGAKSRPAASDLNEGVVTQIKDDDNLVQVTLSEGHGLKKGDTLEVFRLQPAPKYVGQLRLVDLQDRRAVGRMVGRSAQVQVNDRVAKRLVRGDEPAAKAPAKVEAPDDPLQATRDRMVIEEQKMSAVVKDTVRMASATYANDSAAALKSLRTAFMQVWDHPDISERLREQLLNRLAAARHDLTSEK
jgi:WD40 repeat protein